MAVRSEGSFMCHTCCDTWPCFKQFLPKDGTHVPQRDSNPRRKGYQQVFISNMGNTDKVTNR
jgi:hypothetical protein